MKKYFFWIILSIFLNFIFFEFLIGNFIYDEKYTEENNRFSLKPNTNALSLIGEGIFKTRVNDYGSPVYFEKNTNKKRIVFFGDSFVEGFGIKEKNHFISLLQGDSAFNEYEFINLGRSGNSFLDYIYTDDLYYKKTDKKYQHIFILLGYDDFFIKKRKGHYFKNGNNIEYIKFLDSRWKKFIIEELVNRSSLLGFVLQKINKLDLTLSLNKDKKTESGIRLATDSINKINELLDLFESKIDKNNVTFILPSRFNILAKKGGIQDKNIDFLISIFDNREYSYIDLRTDYIDYFSKNKKMPFGFENTDILKGHLNKFGHAILYNNIKIYLEKSIWFLQN